MFYMLTTFRDTAM